MTLSSPFQTFIDQLGFCILDGGLATELEIDGYDLRHLLWSAKILLEKPDAIRKVHYNFLRAGADCITSASYQITYPGCANLSLSIQETNQLLEKSVAVALEARTQFLQEFNSPDHHITPLVAASIGPYGAYLADGSEYSGDYKVSDDQLYDFHIRRWEELVKTDADLIACETIPSIGEARTLFRIIRQSKHIPVYISFSCRDDIHISDGTPIKECATIFKDCPQVIGIGVNCTSPKYIYSLIHQVKEGAPDKEIVVYPNSGEIYDGQRRSWAGAENECSLTQDIQDWYDAGARIIGGCCRVRPNQIHSLRKELLLKVSHKLNTNR